MSVDGKTSDPVPGKPNVPDSDEPIPARLDAALFYWREQRGDRDMPARADIDPLDFPALLPWVMLIDVAHDPVDFSFRLIGTGIVERIERDYTGMSFAELPHMDRDSPIWRQFDSVRVSREPMIGDVPYVGRHHEVRTVMDVKLPLSDGGSRVAMIMSVVQFAGAG